MAGSGDWYREFWVPPSRDSRPTLKSICQPSSIALSLQAGSLNSVRVEERSTTSYVFICSSAQSALPPLTDASRSSHGLLKVALSTLLELAKSSRTVFLKRFGFALRAS